ncbi:hypothetical protein GCM10008955_06190 [Deinococcus malanensis]|uniref:MarR family transcriptional regulator n=1 Tax=Deinococcus malanensis TaxID=1706855 RepID=A0ABQ2EL60_9DEIO|nr:hypothetical protein [Deinococcus malanensis]GGK15535.1 hypothetical protein GCM10008955_06190 [Deinococcus malanensis]
MSGERDEVTNSEVAEQSAGELSRLYTLVAAHRQRLQELHLLGLHLDGNMVAPAHEEQSS